MRLLSFRSRSRNLSAGWLKPQTRWAIIGVLLFLFSLIVILSFFSAAGPTGQAMLTGLRRLIGFSAYPLPFALLWLGYHLMRPNTEGLPRLRLIGMALIVVGALGLLHVVGVAPEDAYQLALDGRGGGLLGFMLAFPLSKAFSWLAALLIFLGTVVTGFFLTFNITPAEVWSWLQDFIPARGAASSGEPYEEETDEGSHLPVFRMRRERLRPVAADAGQMQLKNQEQEQLERMRRQVRAANKRYHPPDLDLLNPSSGRPDSGDPEANEKIIKDTLEKFGIRVTMGKHHTGPTVTQYTLQPDAGVKLARITALQNDLALALAAHSIRIEAPIPGTKFAGIEIPNKNMSLVQVHELLDSRAYRSATSPLTIVLGKDVAGRVKVTTLETMPHLLIAGATGAGKSIFINTLLLSLIYRNSPALVELILIDPKRVELPRFNGVPHLRHPVIVEPEKAIFALRWAVREMNKRYKLLSESGSRDLLSFNANNPEEALPMIVIVIDEFAALMSTHARDLEGIVVHLSQMARATGIHLVLATQRPSVDVITGLIKANIPTRVAFQVASQVDSRTILDAAGADKLLGRGDMLFLSGDQAKPVRLQGGLVSEEEVRQVVADVTEKNPREEEESVDITSPIREHSVSSREALHDNLFEDAKQVVLESRKASASLLQRRLQVGYARAARLLDMLEEHGIVSRSEGNKPREILIRPEKSFGQADEDQVLPDNTLEDDDSVKREW